MIIPPNDACPLDMEIEDFIRYLEYKPIINWTNEEVEWVQWWVRGRPEVFSRMRDTQCKLDW